MKTQIILGNTGSNLADFITRVNQRHGGNFDRAPDFVIDLDGNIHTFPGKQNEKLDPFRNGLVILLENVGALDVKLTNERYVDWKGHEYHGDVVIKEWRNKKHWAVYSLQQISTLGALTTSLCTQYNIPKIFTGDNLLIENAGEYNGIICKSNFNKLYLDVSPAFQFNKLSEILNQSL